MGELLNKNLTLVGFMPEIGDINLIEFNTEEACIEAFLKLRDYLSEDPINLAGVERTLGQEVSLDGIEYIKFKNLIMLVNI
ncbi:MAG: hypothetical protein H7Z70_08030 [Bacteroidia bacterium]|nr:hypothetical protein [Methylotenera sp.]